MLQEYNPLLILVRKLRFLGPPSLIVLLSKLANWEDFEDFLRIVREFTPEHESGILNQSTPGTQMAVFADHFETRYFPLHDYLRGDAEEYCELTHDIPVMLMSCDDEDYHSVESFKPGYQLLTYLLAPPYHADEGARVAWGDACQSVVPTELLQRVPPGGFSREAVALMVKVTPYEGLKLWGDSMNWDTGNFFLDCTEEERGYTMIDWDRETVEELTRMWQQAQEIVRKIDKLADWLGEDPTKHLKELLDFLEKEKPNWDRDLMKLAGQLELDIPDERR